MTHLSLALVSLLGVVVLVPLARWHKDKTRLPVLLGECFVIGLLVGALIALIYCDSIHAPITFK
jgi:hypothetical protein